MRNWNAITNSFPPLVPPGFYFTYEELKLFIGGLITLSIVVFTLPMRNWNIRLFVDIVEKPSSFYFTYEELKHFNGSPSCTRIEQFLLYLWGIETLYQPDIALSGYPFLLYLWGIETWSWTIPALCEQPFLLYLWGIETGLKCFLASRVSSFYFTYEELKHRQ